MAHTMAHTMTLLISAFSSRLTSQDTHPDEWLPSEKWAEVSSEGKRSLQAIGPSIDTDAGVNFISDLLKMRVYQRMTVQCAKEHEWFKSSMDDLDKLYNQVVIKGIHRHPISDEV